MEKNFEKGTIKVVWIEDATEAIYSRMFENLEEALSFAEEKEFLVFKLLWEKDLTDFAWEVLPYGNYKLYKTFIQNYKQYKGAILKFFA